jgi:hypothetical protein
VETPLPVEAETPLPEKKPKRKLSSWQTHVSAFAKEHPKSGRNLFKLAYETYKPTVASTKA